MKNKNKKSGASVASVIVIILLVLIIAVIAVYIGGIVYYKNHFLRGTKINDIDVSGMTIEKLEDKIKSYELRVRERGQTSEEMYVEKINGRDIDIQIVSKDGIQDILDGQVTWKWFTKSDKSYTKDELITYNSDLLEEKVAGLKGLNKEFAKKPVSAKISEYDSKKGFEIIPEEQGNFIDKEKAVEAIKQAVSDLEADINLDEKDCYKKPKVDSGDKALNSKLTKMNKLVSVKITYNFGDKEEVVDGKTISQWLVINKNNVTIDQTKVDDYVSELRRKYDTIFSTRKFKTTYGKTVTLKKGDYGWWMNSDKEAQELAAQIEEGKSGKRTPVYYQTAASYGKNDYGNSYVEINLTAQHLFVYKDGEKVLETDFVSGNASTNMNTPDGVYGITYKERYSVLVGETYESTVAYWMPFNGDIGLHDAIWKTQFGSDFYKTDGSHGCINLPYLTAKKIYSYVEKGTAVICYNLKNTESTSVTVQSYKEIAQAAVEAIDAIGNVTKNSKDTIKDARYMYNKVGQKAQQYVKNYNTLIEAEKKYKELTGKNAS